uniref:Uncharacterized protein n=1 Tax=Trichogramma kaykai TaxID=54128 RepID=A0ABD2VU20_9HYME
MTHRVFFLTDSGGSVLLASEKTESKHIFPTAAAAIITACGHCAAAARYAPMARESGKASEPSTTTTTTAPRHKIPAIFTMYIALYTLNILTFCHVIQILPASYACRARFKALN